MSLQLIAMGTALVAIGSMIPRTSEGACWLGDRIGEVGQGMMALGISQLPDRPLAGLVAAEIRIANGDYYIPEFPCCPS